MTDSERRRSERINVFLAAELETPEGRKSSAVSRDASASGLLLLTRVDLEVGAKIRLHVMRMDQNTPPLEVTGRVARSEPLDDEEIMLWRRKLGVQLEDPPPELLEEIDRFAARQRELYKR